MNKSEKLVTNTTAASKYIPKSCPESASIKIPPYRPHFIKLSEAVFYEVNQRYTYRVLQTIQMKIIPLCVWAEPAVLGSTKTALRFKYEI